MKVPNEFCQLKVLCKSKEEMTGTIVVMEGFLEGNGTWFPPLRPVGLKEGERRKEHILHERKPNFSGVVSS